MWPNDTGLAATQGVVPPTCSATTAAVVAGTAVINLRGLPRTKAVVNIRVKLADRRTISGTRTYRTRTPKRAAATR